MFFKRVNQMHPERISNSMAETLNCNKIKYLYKCYSLFDLKCVSDAIRQIYMFKLVLFENIEGGT